MKSHIQTLKFFGLILGLIIVITYWFTQQTEHFIVGNLLVWGYIYSLPE